MQPDNSNLNHRIAFRCRKGTPDLVRIGAGSVQMGLKEGLLLIPTQKANQDSLLHSSFQIAYPYNSWWIAFRS